MPHSKSLKLALKQADAEIANYVTALEKEVAKLQRQNSKLEVHKLRCQVRIDALQKAIKKLGGAPTIKTYREIIHCPSTDTQVPPEST